MKLHTLSPTGGGWHVEDLRRAAHARGHALTAGTWDTLSDDLRTHPAWDVALPRSMKPDSLETVVFRMDVLARWQRLGLRIVNGPRAIELCVDKYLCLTRLVEAGVPVPPTVCCQRVKEARVAFDQLGRDVVLKPLFGSEGFGMTRLTDADLADRAFAQLERQRAVIYLQQFIPWATDVRLFLINGELIAAMRRQGTGWKHNVATGGQASAIRPDDGWVQLAQRAAVACGVEVAGVDLLIDREGGAWVIEVNACPGWRALASVTGLDIADRIVAHLELT